MSFCAKRADLCEKRLWFVRSVFICQTVIDTCYARQDLKGCAYCGSLFQNSKAVFLRNDKCFCSARCRSQETLFCTDSKPISHRGVYREQRSAKLPIAQLLSSNQIPRVSFASTLSCMLSHGTVPLGAAAWFVFSRRLRRRWLHIPFFLLLFRWLPSASTLASLDSSWCLGQLKHLLIRAAGRAQRKLSVALTPLTATKKEFTARPS